MSWQRVPLQPSPLGSPHRIHVHISRAGRARQPFGVAYPRDGTGANKFAVGAS